MTPKEKAKELVDRMILTYEYTSDYVYESTAKQCALIAVDEIIKETPQLIPEETFIDGSCGVDFFINERFEYWLEVKQEINNI